jgi:hypothetical protein
MDFWLVFVANIHFSLKLKANHFGFWVKTWYFSNPKKFMYNTKTSNWDSVSVSWGWNTDFWPVWTLNRHLLVKWEANPFRFWGQSQYFFKPLKNFVQHLNIWLRQKMDLTAKNYGFLTNFRREHTFFGKSKALLIFTRNSIFFKKKLKILCISPKHLTKIEHGPHGDEIQIFRILSSWRDTFW